MRTFALFCLLILAASPAGAVGYGRADAPRDTDPLTLGRQFCEARIAGDMDALEPHFAPKLVRLLNETAEARTAAGVAWQGRADRPTACTVEILNGFDDTIGVLVGITYKAPRASWTDVINLERTPDSWLINNVFYEGGGNLRFRLFEALSE